MNFFKFMMAMMASELTSQNLAEQMAMMLREESEPRCQHGHDGAILTCGHVVVQVRKKIPRPHQYKSTRSGLRDEKNLFLTVEGLSLSGLEVEGYF